MKAMHLGIAIESGMIGEDGKKTKQKKTKTMQTKTQHTPGPWQYWKPGNEGFSFALGPNGRSPIAKTLGVNEELNESNAKLLAASPELLEALEGIVNDYNDAGCDGCGTIGSKAYAKAVIAIAKAIG